MSGRRQHRFHGDPHQFDVLADFISTRYGNRIRYIADVAGGRGLLSRLLRKRFNYDAEVIDPRGWALKGIPNRTAEFGPEDADYYDLIIGLHPDEATRAVAHAALIRPTIMVPCCNFWSPEKLSGRELIASIADFYQSRGVQYEKVTFSFRGPKNIGLISEPPTP